MLAYLLIAVASGILQGYNLYLAYRLLKYTAQIGKLVLGVNILILGFTLLFIATSTGNLDTYSFFALVLGRPALSIYMFVYMSYLLKQFRSSLQ